MTNQQHKILTVGDIRQDKDEVKSKAKTALQNKGQEWVHPNDGIPAFRPTHLIGHAIFASDLIAFEYRRPL